MAYEGGGKIKTKKYSDGSKPYSRQQSLMGRVKDSVREMLSPSWLVDLVSSVKKKTPPGSPTQNLEENEAVNRPSISNHIDKECRSMPVAAAPQPQRPGGSNRNIGQTELFSSDNFSHFNRFPSLAHPLNGDDNSEVSEYSVSTTGSMIPQPDKKEYQRDILQLNENKIAQMRKELTGSVTPSKELEAQSQTESLCIDEHHEPKSSRFLWTTEVKQRPTPKPQSVAKSNKPSFSVSAFGSSLLPSESGSMLSSTSLHESSYYPGKTTFGGASSFRRSRSQCPSPYQSPGPTRKQMKAKPLSSTNSGVTSSTARKILDALEKMSTPLSDAKKIPSYSNAIADTSLSFTPSSYRRRSLPARAPGSHFDAPPTRSLQTPTMAKIVEGQVKRVSVPSSVTPASSYAPPSENAGGGHGGKMKRDRGGTHYSRAGQEEPEVETPNLPTGFTLPVTNFSAFTFGKPSASSSSAVSPVPGKTMAAEASSPGSCGFKFSSPIHKTDVSVDTSGTSSPAEFKFSMPTNVTSSTASSAPSFTFNSPTSTGLKVKPQSVTVKAVSPRFVQASELKQGSVLDALGSKPSVETSTQVVPLSSLFKPKVGSWECPTCMINNTADINKCVACNTSKPAAAPLPSSTQTIIPKMSPSVKPLSELFKKTPGVWDCQLCMVQNKPDTTECAACQTPKPQQSVAAKQVDSPPKLAPETGPSLIEMFKKPAGSWECNTCMVQNEPSAMKCIACETPKPGAKPTTSFTSAGGFKFGSSGGFQFGSAASDNNNKEAETKVNGGLQFGSAGFKFGNMPSSDVAAKSDGSNSNSVCSDGLGAAVADKPATLPKAITFGAVACDKITNEKKVNLEAKDNDKASVEQPGGFSFGASNLQSQPLQTTKTSLLKSPGFESTSSKTELSKGISFGSSKSDNEPTEGFTFGANKIQSSKVVNFGSDKTDDPPAKRSAFGSKTETEPSKGFAFGSSKTETEPSKGFSFGSSKTETEPPKGLTFGSNKTETEASKFTFGSGNSSNKSHVFGAMDATNNKNGGFSFAPTEPKSGNFVFDNKKTTDSTPDAKGFNLNVASSDTKAGFTFGSKETDSTVLSHAVDKSKGFVVKSAPETKALGVFSQPASAIQSPVLNNDSTKKPIDSLKPPVPFGESKPAAASAPFGSPAPFAAKSNTDDKSSRPTAPTSSSSKFTFGTTTGASTFGNNATPVFGQQQQSTSNSFASPAFGSANPSTTPAFGSGATFSSNTPFQFGQSNPQPLTNNAATFQFGQTPNPTPTAAPFVFGQNSVQNAAPQQQQQQQQQQPQQQSFNFSATPQMNFSAGPANAAFTFNAGTPPATSTDPSAKRRVKIAARRRKQPRD